MPKFNSFVYDIGAASPPDVISQYCYAYFRLSPEYKEEGPSFGFDWVRTGDATDYVAHDEPYEGNVGRNYEEGFIEATDVDDIDAIFRKDDGMFDALCRSYSPGGITLFPSSSGGIERYHTPVLCIYPNNTAEPAKLVLELNIKRSPNYIYLRYDEDTFEITGGDLLTCGPGKHLYELEIVCKKELQEQMYIYVLADDDRSSANLVGLMRIWCNCKAYRRTVKLLVVKVKFMESDAPDAQVFTGETENIKKSLRQFLPHALIKPDITEIDCDMGFKVDFAARILRYNGNMSIIAYDETEGEEDAEDCIISLEDYFKDYLKSIFVDVTPYHGIIISLGAELSTMTLKGGIGTLGGYNAGWYIILGSVRNFNVPAHETLHLLGISHPFNNTHMDGTMTEFTYKSCITDNIMDYSHFLGIKMVNWWEWQWLRARQKAAPE